MLYTSFSLNGPWELCYQEERYTGTLSPYKNSDCIAANMSADAANASNNIIEKAVPGYWEDMVKAFGQTDFFGSLRINPEYGIQQYPIAGVAPDMALPNIVGNFFYRRSFWCEEQAETAENMVLYFGGVQNAASVWVNDIYLGRHEGYSTPFEIEIPAGVLKNGENTVAISVSNHRLEGYAGEPVSGLTSRAANEFTGGITGDVELRVYHSPLREVSLQVSKDLRSVMVEPDIRLKAGEACGNPDFTWQVLDGEQVLKEGTDRREFFFDTRGLEYWSPENPKLYTLKIFMGEGEISHTFGVRRLIPDGVHFQLNHQPYFLRGICEHCYFPETIHPGHDELYYRSIIKNVKNLGFNFIRFHTYIPEEEYLQAADELGMLVHVECPNNTSVAEWEQIVRFCRKHTCVVIYCCGNELQIDDDFEEYLRQCAEIVHKNTDALFSPLSALRGLEYHLLYEKKEELVQEPFRHNPHRIKRVGVYSDMYSSYANAYHSYNSLKVDPESIDAWSEVYRKPRVSHEICIDGTYTDLSLKDRYKGLRVGATDMFASIERHLEEKGLLQKAPLYFKNSSEWQRRVRKYCFEAVRRSNNIAGYDFLGPIDTHWHTFGYDVGMMNEFYELKPGETVRNVLMYNSATVLLTDLGWRTNFTAGETLTCSIFASHYGKNRLPDGLLTVRLSLNGQVIERKNVPVGTVENGAVSALDTFTCVLPETDKPGAMRLYVTLDGETVFVENEWELYLFPKTEETSAGQLIVSKGMEIEKLTELLKDGKDVLLLGAEPFQSLPTTFRIGLAGRTSGNLATVIADHPVLRDLPHEGFCGWQFNQLLEDGQAVLFEAEEVPFNPIVEVVSTHKYVIRQAALFEMQAMGGRLLVCSMDFKETDPAAGWLYSQLIRYMQSGDFAPTDTIDEKGLRALAGSQIRKAAGNTNFAFNPNDKTAMRKKSER